MKAEDIETALDAYAHNAGIRPAQPYYIWGEFNVEHEGQTFYSDEAHEYCKSCAEALYEKVLPLLPEDEREAHRVCQTNCDSEDTCKTCTTCGELLDYALNESGVESELAHYEVELPNFVTLYPGDAFHIARMIEASPEHHAVLDIARKAIDLIPQADAQPS